MNGSEIGMQRRWPAVMVDIETLGTGRDAVITEIGARCFDRKARTTGPGRMWKIGVKEQEQAGRKIEVETLAWWMQQWREGAEMPDLLAGMRMSEAGAKFGEWAREHVSPTAEWWFNGTSFDPVILGSFMSQCKVAVPWKFWQERDVRTVKKLAEVARDWHPRHVAMEDCDAQVLDLFWALAVLEGGAEGRGE